HVELAEVGDGVVDHPVAGGAAVEVDRDGQYPGAEALGLPAGVVEGGGVDVDEAQARALAGKAEGGGATEAVGGAGDQGDLVGKTLAHGEFLIVVGKWMADTVRWPRCGRRR